MQSATEAVRDHAGASALIIAVLVVAVLVLVWMQLSPKKKSMKPKKKADAADDDDAAAEHMGNMIALQDGGDQFDYVENATDGAEPRPGNQRAKDRRARKGLGRIPMTACKGGAARDAYLDEYAWAWEQDALEGGRKHARDALPKMPKKKADAPAAPAPSAGPSAGADAETYIDYGLRDMGYNQHVGDDLSAIMAGY